MVKLLGDSFDLSGFDFSTGLLTSTGNAFSPATAVRPSGGRERENPKTDFMKGARSGHHNSDNLLPPIRQTASIFKQPVTVVKVDGHDIIVTDVIVITCFRFPRTRSPE